MLPDGSSLTFTLILLLVIICGVCCLVWQGSVVSGCICMLVLRFSEVTVLVYLETMNRTHFTLMFVFLHFSVHVRVHVHCPSALRCEKALLCLPIHSLVLVLIVIQYELKRSCFVYSRKRQFTRVRLTFSQPRMILSVHTHLP